MTYNELNMFLLKGGKDNTRKIADNTWVERRNIDDIVIRLHDTDILSFSSDGRSVTVNTGGWATATTKSRLNDYLPGFFIHQKQRLWYWDNGTPFTDGDILRFDGKAWKLDAKATVRLDAELKARKRLVVKVNKYARLCADAVPMEPPGPGDCLFCSMASRGGTPCPEIASHMKEGYVVPSLVYNAIKNKVSPLMLRVAFTPGNAGWLVEAAKSQVMKGVRSYVSLALGLAG